MITFSIALSEQCNLNCTYCNVDKLSKKKISSKIFLEKFEKIRFQNPHEKIQIDFYGGEPLLQWNEIQEIIANTENDNNVVYYMPTNGLLLTEDKVEYLNQKKVQVSLSFDGLWQNENRKQHNGKDTLQIYIGKTNLFLKLKNLQCHSMIYKGNHNLLENHLFIYKEMGLNPDLTLIRDVGVWTHEDATKVNIGFSELVEWYSNNLNDVEMPNLIKQYLKHIILYTSKKIVVDHCGAGISHLSLSENEVIPCNRFKDDDSATKIPEYRHMKECQSCEVRNFCKKGCLYENIKNEGPIAEICTMYKHFYKETIRLIKSNKEQPSIKKILEELIYDA